MLPHFLLSLLLAAVGSFTAHAATNCPPPAACKAAPGTPGWPSQDAWNQLNVSVEGQLLQPTPPGAVCHTDQPSYNSTQCSVLQTAWYTYAFHDSNPVSNAWQEWNNDSCLPYNYYPCSGKGYPVYVINATTPAYVKAGVDFAREHNIRLIVKDSGHDYMGRSVAPNSLSIWTHYLSGITLHQGSFQPQGCPSAVNSSAVTALAGTSMIDLYVSTDAVNQTIVGGGARTIGVGGYVTGAGHGLISAWYGLAADQVLEIEVVTPGGDIVTANACQNQDVFWAMRGGGGGTFGVLTSVTMKTFPSPPLVFINVAIATLNYTSPDVWDVFAYILSQYPSLSASGFAGYTEFYPAVSEATIGNRTVAFYNAALALRDTQNRTLPVQLWAPILAHINATWPGSWYATTSTAAYPSFYGWYKGHYDTSGAGYDILVGSRLLDGTALAANLTATAAAWRQFSAGGVGTAYLVSGKGVADAEPAGGSDAILPAWRRAYVHATTSVAWNATNSTQKAEQTALLDHYVQGLRDLAPNMGAYVNEADPFEPNWQETFWGDNYPRLLAIKKALDPTDVFWCHPCVGSEGWQEVGNLLCRV